MNTFRRSSKCSSHAMCCVEVAVETGRVVVRHSQEPAKTIVYTREEWDAFIQGVKEGEFDLRK